MKAFTLALLAILPTALCLLPDGGSTSSAGVFQGITVTIDESVPRHLCRRTLDKIEVSLSLPSPCQILPFLPPLSPSSRKWP